ncbi:GGDEF domain-containing protein [Pseudoduganella sp. OTU4001]|uniref:GGDEF domain-containing protein n=1 Tax=Pseudoduganella sp. OTU4001 TaxID=3043854 RepID=UPI00313C3E5B
MAQGEDLNDEFSPLDDDAAGAADSTAPPWRILVVDDNEPVHAVTRLVLHQIVFRGRPIELVSAFSAAEARAILKADQSFAVAFVDVIMETPLAGLDLVREIRDQMQNRKIRIILRTGQPNQVPEQDVVLSYEIDDYLAKTEISARKLVTSVISSLRAFAYISELEALNQELEARVEMRTADLAKLAMIDPLTGAGNRRHFEERAATEIREVQRAQTALGVVAFDIDHFKQVNDREGHAAGDQVLRSVVERVQSTLRPCDFLARIGGEEFVVLLPGEDSAGAAVVAERLREALAASPVMAGGVAIPVTASFGVAQLEGELSLELPLRRADSALYLAKAQGRNRVMTSQHSVGMANLAG